MYCFGLQFTTPSFPGDPWLAPFPITFITYEVSIIDGMNHSVEIYYDNTGEVWLDVGHGCECLCGACVHIIFLIFAAC